MTYINNAVMLAEEEIASDISNKHNSKIQDKKIWKSLRTHILSRREKNKQDEIDAEMLRKKKCVEYQKMEENKLSLAQINGRLSQLRDKRDELEDEKMTLINQMRDADNIVCAQQTLCEPVNSKLVVNNINPAALNHRSTTLLQQQHIYRQQNTLSGANSPAAGSGLSPLSQQSLMMNSNNTGGSNQTLLVCSPVTLNAVIGNKQNNVTCSTVSGNTFTKFPALYSSNSTHLLPPNVGTASKMGRTPSPNFQQSYQPSQIVTPFPTYKPMNSAGNNINNLKSTIVAPVVNNMNQSSNYSIENANRRVGRDDLVHPFNRNVWINNNTNNVHKNAQPPNVSNYGSFYQPNSTNAVNYCVNGMSSSSTSSSVNTVFSYSGPHTQPLQRTEPSNSGKLMVGASGEIGAQQQIPKSIMSHRIPLHPPMYMSPSIRNQPNNHSYHSKPPHSVYSDDKSTPSNFYQHQQGIRNVHSSNTAIFSQPHQMSQKPHTIGYPIRHSISSSQLSPAIIQSSQHSQHTTYNVPTCVVTGYPNKSSAANASTGDNPRYQPPASRHE